jgi:hypothetical protein
MNRIIVNLAGKIFPAEPEQFSRMFHCPRLVLDSLQDWETILSDEDVRPLEEVRTAHGSAEAALRTFQREDPDEPEAAAALGVYLALTGRASEASRFLEIAALKPEASDLVRYMYVDSMVVKWRPAETGPL